MRIGKDRVGKRERQGYSTLDQMVKPCHDATIATAPMPLLHWIRRRDIDRCYKRVIMERKSSGLSCQRC